MELKSHCSAWDTSCYDLVALLTYDMKDAEEEASMVHKLLQQQCGCQSTDVRRIPNRSLLLQPVSGSQYEIHSLSWSQALFFGLSSLSFSCASSLHLWTWKLSPEVHSSYIEKSYCPCQPTPSCLPCTLFENHQKCLILIFKFGIFLQFLSYQY